MKQLLLAIFISVNGSTLKDAVTLTDPDTKYVFSYQATQRIVPKMEASGEPFDLVIQLCNKAGFKITKWSDSYYIYPNDYASL